MRMSVAIPLIGLYGSTRIFPLPSHHHTSPPSARVYKRKLKSFYSISSIPHLPRSQSNTLVHTLEWGHSLALVLVQSVANNATETEFDLAVGLLLERQSVFHPVLVVTLRVVLTGVSTAGFLAVGSRVGSLGAGNNR